MTNMTSSKRNLLVVLLVLTALLLLPEEGIALEPEQPTCCSGSSAMPDANATSGRFINILRGLESLGEQGTQIELRVPATQSEFRLAIFDGDKDGKWDYSASGVTPRDAIFTLWADPTQKRLNTVQVAQWLGEKMVDDEWYFPLAVSNTQAANPYPGDPGPDGDFCYYNLVVSWAGTPPSGGSGDGIGQMNNFKVWAEGDLFILAGSTYGFIGYNWGPHHNSYPDSPRTSYDGTWNFALQVPDSATELNFWTGDFDHGADTDDPNTPATDLFPVPTVTQAEGENPGDPADNGVWDKWLTVGGHIRQTVIFPSGVGYTDLNPSGNREWEVFRLGPTSDDGNSLNEPDIPLVSIPSGTYFWQITDVDARNTLFIRPDYDLRTPRGCASVGDRVWLDEDKDGKQDVGEPGIVGVTVQLWWDSNEDGTANAMYGSAVTKANGLYLFEKLPSGDYEVRVVTLTLAPELKQTFDLNGPLDHCAAITLATDQNPRDVDFGYNEEGGGGEEDPPGTGTPGYWKNHPDAWPADTILIGDVTYPRDDAIAAMKKPTKKDMTYQLFQTLVAAKLNVAVGNSDEDEVAEAINDANAWFVENDLGSGVRAKSDAWKDIADVHELLDDYNNGLLDCADARD